FGGIRQDIDRLLERDGAKFLQAAPGPDAQIGRRRRQLMDEHQPAARRGGARAAGGLGIRLHSAVTTVAQYTARTLSSRRGLPYDSEVIRHTTTATTRTRTRSMRADREPLLERGDEIASGETRSRYPIDRLIGPGGNGPGYPA